MFKRTIGDDTHVNRTIQRHGRAALEFHTGCRIRFFREVVKCWRHLLKRPCTKTLDSPNMYPPEIAPPPFRVRNHRLMVHHPPVSVFDAVADFCRRRRRLDRATLIRKAKCCMAKNSAIEWTAHTFNPWWGCTKISPACDHCYAETWSKRTGYDVWGANSPRRQLSDDYWNQPIIWDRHAAQTRRRARVFCASMADVFELDPALDSLRKRLWALVEQTPNLDWLLLTKRPHLARRMAPWDNAWPLHVWLGTSVENQQFADRRIRFLADVPCRYRFLSCEPLLGPLDLSTHIEALHWIIAGGESGSQARPTHPDWVRGVRDQCVNAGVAFHFKQWGNWYPQETAGSAHNGERISFVRTSKKKAGRILDGRTWDELPHGYSEKTVR